MTTKIYQANLIKNAFALAIKEQQDIIVEKNNALKYNLDHVLMHEIKPYKKSELLSGIKQAKDYIKFYSMMYMNAEEIRVTEKDKRIKEVNVRRYK